MRGERFDIRFEFDLFFELFTKRDINFFYPKVFSAISQKESAVIFIFLLFDEEIIILSIELKDGSCVVENVA